MAFGVYNECRVVVRTVVLSQAGRAVVLSAMRHCSSMELVDGLARACTECEMEALAWRVCTSISKVQQELVSLARKPVTHRLRTIPHAHLNRRRPSKPLQDPKDSHRIRPVLKTRSSN